jgi:hypothetical protein
LPVPKNRRAGINIPELVDITRRTVEKQDIVEQLVLDSVVPKLAQGLEVSFIDTTVLVRRERNIGPNPSEVLVDCVLSL